MEALEIFNGFVKVMFFMFYAYQFFYILVAILKKPKRFNHLEKEGKIKPHRFAVMISARNEEAVIGQLLESINRQTYPRELVDIFVAADNCTDQTAKVAAEHGAKVYKRFNQTKVGKGYALEMLFNVVREDYGHDYYDGYFVFDADNLLDPHYIEEMNKTFSAGYRVLTSYRNSKNYGANWISAGYALWFLREARHLNNARMILNTSCAISGTGFLLSNEIIEKNDGWKHFLLTEDIEFTVDSVCQGEKIGYCHDAMLYDEQPETFKQSWTQRLRWAKGYYQVFYNYGTNLLSGIFRKGSFSCYDMCMTIMPALFLTLLTTLVNGSAMIYALINHTGQFEGMLFSMLWMVVSVYGMFIVVGGFALITEWKNIHCSTWKKIKYLFTFPIFMLTYIPISITALFRKIEWKPITHTVAISIDQMKAGQ